MKILSLLAHLEILLLVVLSLSGCGTVSLLALHGVYIESSTGHNFALDFEHDGVSVYSDETANPSGDGFIGTCLATGGKYTLLGDTVRIEGGTDTQAGLAEQMLTSSGGDAGGNVTLLKVTNSGQQLQLTTPAGQVVNFIKQ